MVSAFAILSKDDDRTRSSSIEEECWKVAPRARRILDGVGMPRGAVLCMVADRSNRTAAGVVKGRRCA